MKYKFGRLGLMAASFVLCINWGSQDTSVQGGSKPQINFKGVIVDNTDKAFNAENITIANSYKQIMVYVLPAKHADDMYDPSINKAFLDLAEINKITVEHPIKIYTFKGRDYLLLQVLYNDNSTNNYIVELNKKIYCDQVNHADSIERELDFRAVQYIEITGYAAAKTEVVSTKKASDQTVADKQPLSKPKSAFNRIKSRVKKAYYALWS